MKTIERTAGALEIVSRSSGGAPRPLPLMIGVRRRESAASPERENRK